MAIEYTAQMEELLDKIEEGSANYLTTIDGFYEKFKKDSDDLEYHHLLIYSWLSTKGEDYTMLVSIGFLGKIYFVLTD